MYFVKIIEALTKEILRSGVDIKTRAQVVKVHENSRGIIVTLDTGEELPPTDIVLWAVGRSPNTGELGCEGIDMLLDTHGQIVVDDFQNTNIKGVYALGDVAGKVRQTKYISVSL